MGLLIGVYVGLFSPLLGRNLQRAVRVITFAALFFFAVKAWPVEASFKCEAFKDTLPRLMKQGYGLLSIADLRNDGSVLTMLNRSTGQWYVIGIDKDMNACGLLVADNFRFFSERNI